jgi:hypothetical protein
MDHMLHYLSYTRFFFCVVLLINRQSESPSFVVCPHPLAANSIYGWGKVWEYLIAWKEQGQMSRRPRWGQTISWNISVMGKGRRQKKADKTCEFYSHCRFCGFAYITLAVASGSGTRKKRKGFESCELLLFSYYCIPRRSYFALFMCIRSKTFHQKGGH